MFEYITCFSSSSSSSYDDDHHLIGLFYYQCLWMPLRTENQSKKK